MTIAPSSGPTRRAVLAGGLALAGGALVRPWNAEADSIQPGQRTLLLVAVPGRRAEAAWARAAPLLTAKGQQSRPADWLIAEGYRPVGFQGRLVTPAALLDVSAARLATLLTEPKLAQITSTRIPVRDETEGWIDALAALLREPVSFASCIVAIEPREAERVDAALRPLAALRLTSV